MSMAAGEYVSVHSQADTEEAELELERGELQADDKGEHQELMAIYVARGLSPSLAKQVADQLMVHDALGAHARDELGISDTLRARPIQAALTSASSFAIGAAMPLLVTAVVPAAGLILFVSGTSLAFLALLGGLAAYVGGAAVAAGAIRVTFWGAAAMGADCRRRVAVRNSRRRLTPSMRRPVGVKTVLVFLSVDPDFFTEPPLSPSFHPQSLMSDFRSAASWASSIQ